MTVTLEDQLAAYRTNIDRAISEHTTSNDAEHTGTVNDNEMDASPRRRRPGIMAAAAAATIAVVAGLTLLSVESTPAWADWSPLVQPADPADVAALDTLCRTATEAGQELDALIFDIRGAGGAAIYGDGTRWVTCQADRNEDGEFEVASTFSHTGNGLTTAKSATDADTPVTTIALGWQGDPAASIVWGIHHSLTAPSISIVAGDSTIEAATNGDVWVAWWPTSGAETSRLLATDPTGSVIVDELAGALAPRGPDRDALVAAIELDGTDLERSIIADGIVTWEELKSALDAWQACVAADGYELRVTIDDDALTYELSGPIVAIAGEPDDVEAQRLLAPSSASIQACGNLHASRIEQAFRQQ